MKKLIVLLGLFMALASAMDIKEFEEKYHEHFADPEEEAKAAKALAEHEAQINQQHEEYVQGKANFDEEINEFADMDDDELAEEKLGLVDEPSVKHTFGGRTFYLGLIRNDGENRNTPEEIAELDEIYAAIDRETLPESYDSRAHGLVTSVKNQGNCGSCVAFATTATLESNLLKAGASMDGLDVSDQHLVDCANRKGYGAYGCDGAWGPAYAKFYNNEGKQMVHESTYPYVMKENNYKCKQTSYWHPGYKIDEGKWDFECTDEKMMKLVYQYGAVGTGVYCEDGFFSYKKGVYDQGPNKGPNHQVAVVGWGTENGIDYWLIKNSWGTGWGDQGYIKVKRGTCGMVAEFDQECVFFDLKSASGGGDETTTVPPDDDCKDDDEYKGYCSSYKEDCTNDFHKEALYKYCKKTCGFCNHNYQMPCNMVETFGKLNGDHTLKLTASGKHYTSKVNCEDGLCTAINPDILYSCHYICGTFNCDHVMKPECKDTEPNKKCRRWKRRNWCTKKKAFMTENCKKTCNLC